MRNVFSLNVAETYSKDLGGSLGQLRIEDDKIYKMVQNKTGGTRTAGDLVVYDVGTDATHTKVYAPATAKLMQLAGVLVGAPLADEYCWMQIWGYSAVVNTMGHASMAVGDSLIAVDAQYYGARSTAVGTAPIYGAYIICLEAYTTTSAAIKKGFIRCM
jgi:hypothetical protein